MKSAYAPHQLRLIDLRERGYMCVGEVMSYETPARTVMVRRVPGHPGTLEELSVDVLGERVLRKYVHYVHYAVVAGSGQFPVDMLRYDTAAPVNFKIVPRERGGVQTEIDPAFGLEGLVVARVTDKKDPGWTAARWSSFLWGVRPLKTEALGSSS